MDEESSQSLRKKQASKGVNVVYCTCPDCFILCDENQHLVTLAIRERWRTYVGHSIGVYICIEVFKRLTQQVISVSKVKFAIGLYPFLRNGNSSKLVMIKKLSEEPDTSFVKMQQDQIAFLYGIDDHWGPLSGFEREAGSLWAARYVARLIKASLIGRIPN